MVHAIMVFKGRRWSRHGFNNDIWTSLLQDKDNSLFNHKYNFRFPEFCLELFLIPLRCYLVDCYPFIFSYVFVFHFSWKLHVITLCFISSSLCKSRRGLTTFYPQVVQPRFILCANFFWSFKHKHVHVSLDIFYMHNAIFENLKF